MKITSPRRRAPHRARGVKTTRWSWSKPYYGHTHIGAFSTQNPWVTVIEFSGSAELVLWIPGCGFSPERRDYPNAEKAKRAGERWMKSQYDRRK